MKRLFILSLFAFLAAAHADPQLTSWFTADTGKFARIYNAVANPNLPAPVTTWSRGTTTQTNPVYAGINEINTSANWVYIRTSGLASYVMGPWPANFPSFPTNTASIYRIPRLPAVPGTKTNTGLGVIGRFVNGVSLFDSRDAFSYVNGGTEANPGDGIWSRDAWVNEQATFDPALAHQAGNNYHNHAQPIALRYQLGDHVTFTAPNTYAEAATAAAHSPIIAWAADGYPIYGPYGYSDPTNASSGVRRMVSGYVLRNGSNGTTNLASTGRTTLPAWALTAQNRSQLTLPSEYGPAVSTTYPLGRYIEDNDFLGDIISPVFTQTTGATVRDYDLDRYNGRNCVTPDFPGGTYAYFTTITATGTPVYPYNIGRQFYGSPTGGARTEAQMLADTPLTQQFIGGANKPLTINTPSVSGTTVTLTWSGIEGGTYSVDASPDQSTWTSKATGIVAATDSASSTFTALGTSGTEYGRVNRTALPALYDSNGQTPATAAQTTQTTYSLGTAVAPTVTTPTSASIGGGLATLGGNVTSDGGGAITARGVVVALTSTNNNPLIGGSGVTNVAGTGTTGIFTVDASGLAASSNYTFKAYATNSAGTSYSAYTNFTTLSNNANLSNLVLSAGTLNPAFAQATIAYTASVPNSTSSITVTPTRAQPNATITVNGTAVASGTASGSIALNVGANTITTVVTAQDGTLKTYTVTVTRDAAAPTVTTPTSASVTSATATLGGNVTADGGATITARGVVFAPTATNSNPQIGGTGVVNVVGTGTTGVFTINATGLTPSTPYTFAAYATNSVGTTYSVTGSFTSQSNSADLSNLVLSAGTLSPVFASATIAYTATVSNATAGITVTPTALQGSPTITVNGAGVTSGTASGNIALNVGTNAISIVVTGADTTTRTYTVTVTRQSGAPIVTTPTSAGVTLTAATLGGNVVSDGGIAITARGVVFAPTATNANPQIGGTGVTNVTGSGTTGIFTVNATGLTLGTPYTFAAYATNSVGTTYSATGTFTTPRNNILLIIADDYGLDASTLFNSTPGAINAPTPNLASLAANGVKFTNAYAYAVCSPTRSAMLTGRYGFRTGTGDVVQPTSGSPLQASEFTLPKAFAANPSLNYKLKHVGKYHLVNGNSQAAQMSPVTVAGWPSYAGCLSAEVADYMNWTKVVTDGSALGTSSFTVSVATGFPTPYATTDTANDAISFISAQTAAGKPWFAWVAFNAPHFPFHKPPNSLLTTAGSIALSGDAADITANKLNYFNASVEALDTEIGRLLANVDLNTTTVIFIGDNGTDTQVLQAPYPGVRGKNTLYEGGVRVPIIIRGPGVVSPNRTSTALVHAVDLYSTILEIAGINVATTVPSGTVVDSQSLVPILQNQTVTRPVVYSELFNTDTPTFGGQELRDTRYKIIRPKSGSNEFYDLQVDPYEATNLLAGGVSAMTSAQQTAYYQLLAELGNYSTTAPTTINSVTLNPTVPTNADNVTMTANVTPATGTTLSSVQLTYNNGTPVTTTLWSETMGTAAGPFTTASNGGTDNTWTVVSAAGKPNPFSQTNATNHGAGNTCSLDFLRGTPFLTDNYITTTNPIPANHAGAFVEFYVATSNLVAGNGWALQLSPDGTIWTTRLSETTGSNHGYTLYHYDLDPTEQVNTLKMRFQFAGNGPANPASDINLDDIRVAYTTGAGPVTIPMTAGTGGNYTATIPLQTTGTAVSYSVLATDSAAGIDYVSSSYTVVAPSPALSVTPAGNFSSSGTAGSGTFTPSSQAYTLTNSGSGTMSWTAGKTATWLNLSSASGTLAAGASTTVTASINTTNANTLGTGTYNDTITFTNSTNGAGNTTRTASLAIGSSVPPAAPALAALPTYSQGSAKTIPWNAVSGATSYTLQISATSDFATVLSSQTVANPTATFTNLAHGVTYYYRALATNGVGSSIYSNVVSSTQDNVAPIVAITSPASGTSTPANTITVSGTSSDALSGISKVTVNGVTATTSNGFANWTLSVPLGFGTNSLTALAIDNAGNTTSSTAVLVTLTTAQTYNPLIIPDTITGTTFNLALGPTSKQFLAGAATTTNAYNNMLYGAPTLIMNKGDGVQMNVTNNLAVDTTTTHWHGFHIPAIMDGGPHQTVPAGTTWSPSWTVMNNAGTYWYHPHVHTKTQEQVSRGAVGMIIIRDPQEAALALPRTYGVDDIPLALGSRRFTTNQIVTVNSAYGDTMLVNGVINPQVSLPKQYVRLRILNAEIERSLNLGFSDNRTFWVIATDGGLVDAPVATTRLLMGVGERYEILVDLSSDTPGASIDLMAYNSSTSLGTPLANSFPGGEPATNGQFGSLLNNVDFNILHITIAAQTASPVLARPATLTTNALWTNTDVTSPTTRTLNITGGAPGLFFFNTDQLYSPTVFNQTINFNAVERWTVTNTSGFSHSFHIHDIQFALISRVSAGAGPAVFTGISTYEQGWKDTLYVQRNSSVTFIAKFDHFASNTNPFMYHCHFANHEDEGLMGQFVVVNSATEDLAVSSFTRTGNNNIVSLQFKATPGTTYTLQHSPDMSAGSWTDVGSVTSDGTSATFIETNATRLGQPKAFYRVNIPTVP